MIKISLKIKKIKSVSPTLQLIAALALFILATAASRSAQMALWEINLFTAIYSWPEFLHPLFIFITQFGSIYVLGILAILYLLKQHYHIVLRLLLSGTLAYMLAGVAKDLWGRGRPFELIPDIVSLEFIVRGPGYPSGHMAMATVLAFTLGHYLHKKYRLLLAAGALAVGLSRIYLGVHAPLDIVGGFAIGWAAYAIFRHVRLYDIRLQRHKNKNKKTYKKQVRAKSSSA